MGIYVVVLSGDPGSTAQFYHKVKALPWNNIVWINNEQRTYPSANLIVLFGGKWDIPHLTPFITWSGDDDETLERVYKTLHVV